MTRNELARVLELQNQAYNLLLWIDEQSKNQPDLLSDENLEAWRFAQTCDAWVRQMIGIFPRDLRPHENDISAFSHLLSSFFNTSFHIDEKNESDWARYRGHHYDVWSRRKLVPGVSVNRKTKAQKEKVSQSAHNLQLLAMEELAIENDFDLTRRQLEALIKNAGLAEAINLWSYGHELVRRSQFASQGAAVHAMWRTMDKKTRKSLNADTIWQARQQLLDGMTAIAAIYR